MELRSAEIAENVACVETESIITKSAEGRAITHTITEAAEGLAETEATEGLAKTEATEPAITEPANTDPVITKPAIADTAITDPAERCAVSYSESFAVGAVKGKVGEDACQ